MGDKDDSFDIKFTALMPDLQVKLWLLGLDANTSRVNLAYKPGSFVTSLTYNYGGSLDAAFTYRQVGTKLSVNPSDGGVNLGIIYRGFNFSAMGNYLRPAAGAGLTYGADLVPFPSELTNSFNLANGGLMNMAGDISAAPNNPLSWYKLHSNDVTAITNGIDAGQKIYKAGESKDQFGFGLRLNYDKQTGMTIYGGAVYRF